MRREGPAPQGLLCTYECSFSLVTSSPSLKTGRLGSVLSPGARKEGSGGVVVVKYSNVVQLNTINF